MLLLTELPAELLDMIAACLLPEKTDKYDVRKPALVAWALTSQKTLPSARRYLYRNAVFGSKSRERYESFNQSVTNNDELGKLVRSFGSVDISDEGCVDIGDSILLKRLVNLESIDITVTWESRHLSMYVLMLGSLTTLKEINLHKPPRRRYDCFISKPFLRWFERLPYLRTVTDHHGQITFQPPSACSPLSKEQRNSPFLEKGNNVVAEMRCGRQYAQECCGVQPCPILFASSFRSLWSNLRTFHYVVDSTQVPSHMDGVGDHDWLSDLSTGIASLKDTLEELAILCKGVYWIAATGETPQFDLSRHQALKRLHTNAYFLFDVRSIPDPVVIYSLLPAGIEKLWIEFGVLPPIYDPGLEANWPGQPEDAACRHWAEFFKSPGAYGLENIQQITLREALRNPPSNDHFHRIVLTLEPREGSNGVMVERADVSYRLPVRMYRDHSERPIRPWSDWALT